MIPLSWPKIHAFIHDETATSTIEFVIMLPVVMTLFIAVFESGMILSRQVLLERSLDEAVRILRLSRGLNLTAADIADAICDNTAAIPNCRQVLVVDLRRIDTATYALPAQHVACVDRRDITVAPANLFEQGQDNDLVLIRTCAVIDRILPFSGFALNLVRDDTGGLHITASSVFVNEPA